MSSSGANLRQRSRKGDGGSPEQSAKAAGTPAQAAPTFLGSVVKYFLALAVVGMPLFVLYSRHQASVPGVRRSYGPSSLLEEVRPVHDGWPSPLPQALNLTSMSDRGGYGLVANQDLQRGDLLLIEPPLFVIRTTNNNLDQAINLLRNALSPLTEEDRITFFSLANSQPTAAKTYARMVAVSEGRAPIIPTEDDDPLGTFVDTYDSAADLLPAKLAKLPLSHLALVHALGILHTNGLASPLSSGGEGVGIYPRIARANHACLPTATYHYRGDLTPPAMVVHAISSIRKGEEILVTYGDVKKPQPERYEWLYQRYHFHCSCKSCSRRGVEKEKSDERWKRAKEAQEKADAWVQGGKGGKSSIITALGTVEKLWEMEGYDSEKGRLYSEVAAVFAAYGDADNTKLYAEKSADDFAVECGSTAPEVKAMRDVAQKPSTHRLWASRQKKA